MTACSSAKKMSAYILDSHALLQYFQNEPGSAKVEQILEHCAKVHKKALLTLINWGELYYIVKRKFGDERLQMVLQHLEQLPIQIIPIDTELVRNASEIKAKYPLSYADAFCVAAAKQHKGTILTGDPEFHSVENIVSLQWTAKK